MDQSKNSHYIRFANNSGMFYIPGSTCDLDLIGFIPSDKSLPIKSMTPIKYLSGSKVVLQLAQPMLESDMDAFLVGDGHYLLRSFRQNDLFLLCICKPIMPIFPGASFDGRFYIKPMNLFKSQQIQNNTTN